MATTIHGIDVSDSQRLVDFTQVAASEMDFAFVRVGFCGFDGKIVKGEGLDPAFRLFMRGANAVRFPVGAYLSLHARSPGAALAAARETLALVAEFDLQYPLALNIEDAWYVNAGRDFTTDIAAAFLGEIAAAGYYPMLHTYKAFAEQHLNMDRLPETDLWITSYTDTLDYKGKGEVCVWQHHIGDCDGVPLGCDWDRSYRDYEIIISTLGMNRPGQRLSREMACAKHRMARLIGDAATL